MWFFQKSHDSETIRFKPETNRDFFGSVYLCHAQSTWFHFKFSLMAIPVDHFSMERRTFPKLYLCIVCNLYSYSDIAHEKSLWIHGISHDIPRTKLWGLAMVHPTESSLPIGKQQMVNTGNCTTQWTHCCDLALKLRHIAKHLTNSRAWAKRMANFRASLYKN